MKINELENLGIYTAYIDRPQTGFYDASGLYQPYPEQCPKFTNGLLVVEDENGQLLDLELVKHRSEKANCEVAFRAGGWFWTWNENNAGNEWTATENEPDDAECQFLGEWIIAADDDEQIIA